MAAHMPVRAIARLVGEHDTRLWRIIHHYVDTARGQRDDSGVRSAGIDDESVRRAAITFDEFHVMKLLSEAIEKTRREEQKSTPDLEGHRFALLENPENMRDDELEFASALGGRR